MSFEETQRKDLDFSSYLYTVNAKSKKIPDFISTPQTGSVITLKRRYRDFNFDGRDFQKSFPQQPVAAVIKATIPSPKRDLDYVIHQSVSTVVNKVKK